ncbi:hypothetical protein [Salinicola avicenniae]|uniref:hypothetical protein n=1 Tax=Salinicola avicenniae TaxID=2916836 RepID=UPI002073D4FE|nr:MULTISPECIES: hypothetical protein [unclassified Salinicola]
MTATVLRTAGTVVTVTVGIVLGWTAAYQLPGSEKAADDGVPSEPREVGDALTGELTSASQLNVKDGSRYARIPVQLDADTFVQFELDGPLDGTLSLLDANDKWLASSANTVAASGLASEGGSVSVGANIEEAGTYWLAVSGRDSRSYGPFEVESRTLDVRNDGDLATEDEVAGFLTKDPNTYTLGVEEAGLYRFTMRSDVVDAYLHLTGDGVDASDDDSGGGTSGYDAQLTAYLEPGDYEIEASAYGSVTSGMYSLVAEPQPLPLPTGDTLRNGGEVSAGDELTGYMSGDGREYTLNVDEAASYTIDMRADDLDSYLELTGEGVTLSDDDSGGDYDARIQAVLQPGTYTIRASSYGSGSAGLFTLAVATSEANVLSEEERRLDGVGRLEDMLMSNGGTDYVWHIDEAGRYAVTMRSSDLDAFLMLTGDSGIDLSDDDSGGGYDARIETNLAPGDYTVNASSYGGGTGSFELQTEKLD